MTTVKNNMQKQTKSNLNWQALSHQYEYRVKQSSQLRCCLLKLRGTYRFTEVNISLDQCCFSADTADLVSTGHGDFLVQIQIYDKIFMKIRSVLPDCRDTRNIVENARSRNAEKSFKRLPGLDLAADDLTKLISVLPCPQIHLWWNFQEDPTKVFTQSC